MQHRHFFSVWVSDPSPCTQEFFSAVGFAWDLYCFYCQLWITPSAGTSTPCVFIPHAQHCAGWALQLNMAQSGINRDLEFTRLLLEYRWWVPLNPNTDNPNSQLIQSPMEITYRSIVCLISNLLYVKDFYFFSFWIKWEVPVHCSSTKTNVKVSVNVKQRETKIYMQSRETARNWTLSGCRGSSDWKLPEQSPGK